MEFLSRRHQIQENPDSSLDTKRDHNFYLMIEKLYVLIVLNFDYKNMESQE